MTHIDFYILPDLTRDAALRFACRLSLKGCESGMPVHIHTADDGAAAALDELMWDYPKHRFVPHERIDNGPSPAPVHISTGAPLHDTGLLINLNSEVPSFFGRFDRVAEIVVGEDRDNGRERYRYYRHRGCPLRHHELSDWEAS